MFRNFTECVCNSGDTGEYIAIIQCVVSFQRTFLDTMSEAKENMLLPIRHRYLAVFIKV